MEKEKASFCLLLEYLTRARRKLNYAEEEVIKIGTEQEVDEFDSEKTSKLFDLVKQEIDGAKTVLEEENFSPKIER